MRKCNFVCFFYTLSWSASAPEEEKNVVGHSFWIHKSIKSKNFMTCKFNLKFPRNNCQKTMPQLTEIHVLTFSSATFLQPQHPIGKTRASSPTAVAATSSSSGLLPHWPSGVKFPRKRSSKAAWGSSFWGPNSLQMQIYISAEG